MLRWCRCGLPWLRRWRRTSAGSGPPQSCGRPWRGVMPRSRGSRLSLSGCAPRWRSCSGWCSGIRRSGRGRSRRHPGVRVAGSRRPAARVVVRAGRGGRGRGRGGGITRTCPGLRWSGTLRAAGTAARSAGRRSRGWAVIMSRSCWTGGSSSGWRRTERFVAGRSMNSLVTGLSRQGAEISPATLAGTCAQAGALLVPLADAVTERSRGSWHLHADETTWRVFAPRDGGGPAKWWLWVFIGPDTVCFVMDPTRAGAVLARHAGIDEKTGQLTADEDGGPRSLVISSDFYKVYESAGKKADGLVNLFCWAHVRRHFVRAGDANPVQLKYWTDVWLERIRDLYAAHDGLMAAWQDAAAPAPRGKEQAAAALDRAYAAWDQALAVIDEARKKQMAAPGLQEPAKKALATLDREWDGLI